MSFRYPNITAQNDREKLAQVQSYLHQLVDQLNMVGLGGGGTGARAQYQAAGYQNPAPEKEALDTFNSIKALIIKSADIVNYYYDQISTRLEGAFVAESEFGSFAEQTTQDIEANSMYIQNLFTNIQTIVSELEEVQDSVIEVNAHIKSGLLYYGEDGAPVYGLEIGQRNEIDGVEVFNQFARFTAEKLAFYDQNGNEVAYISDRKLFISNVEITGSLRLGGFVDSVQPDGSVVTKWIGGAG